MSPSPESASKSATGTTRGWLRRGPHPAPRLNATMSCDIAFRVIARRYLADLAKNHKATCNGDPNALHQMRIALTHLRTAILFFSPILADTLRRKITRELKWLNTQLGA